MNTETCATKPVDVTEDVYDTSRTENLGWCTQCEDFTTADVMPSETGVRCTQCVEDTVVGARHALHAGFITIERAVLQ